MRISDWSSDVCSSELSAPGHEESELLRLAAGVERASEHPLALAVVAAAKDRGIALPEVTDFDSPTGKGAFGTVDGKRISLGNARFLSDRKSTRLNSSH